MKKIFATLVGVMMALTVFAQQEQTDIMQARKQLHTQLNSRLPQRAAFPLAEMQAAKDASKELRAEQMPASRWFPGEWDEVKAIFITCNYIHYPAAHDNDPYWTADPVVTGYATYYHYSGGWQQSGSGAYVSHPDTSDEAYGEVFFHLMDGIQQAGAEAWVRVEQMSDSSCIQRKLARMGLRSDNIRFIEAPGNSFWYRDCGPICFYYGDQDSVAQLDFMYYPGRALDDSLSSAIEVQMGLPDYITDIEWEGGNCLVDGAGLVMSSDAIYSNNLDRIGQLVVNGSNINYSTKPKLTKQQVQDSLASLMAPRGCKILPAFKYDGGTGHIDLYADMWTESEFVFSKFPTTYSSWKDYATAAKNIDSMTSWQTYFDDAYYTKRYIPFPCTDNGGTFSSQTNYNKSYTRSYSNHTFVNKTILQPCFSTVVDGEPSAAWDKARIDSLRMAYPGYTIYPINVKSFDGYGGAIHCITKQIPADNPIRFIHKAYMGNTGDAFYYMDMEIKSVIRNRSGIAEAKIFWRANEGTWNEAPMTLDATSGIDGLYTGIIPTAYVGQCFPMCDTCSVKIEYYITATSNNGKTMSKPITADQGGYFTYYMGNSDESLAIEHVDIDGMGQFYPNPAREQAHLRMELGEGCHYNVTLLDAAGRTLHTSTLDASGSIVYTLETSHLSAGLYTVVFDAPNHRITRKLLVN